jgi:hypothetical protein
MLDTVSEAYSTPSDKLHSIKTMTVTTCSSHVKIHESFALQRPIIRTDAHFLLIPVVQLLN